MEYLIPFLVGAVLWIALSIIFYFFLENKKVKKWLSKSENLIKEAERKKDNILNEAKKEQEKILKETKDESNDIIKKAEKIEERAVEKETKVDKKIDELNLKQNALQEKEEELKEKWNNLDSKIWELENKLSELSKLSEDEAKELFLSQVKDKYEWDALWLIEKHKKFIEEKKKEIAREIVVKSIQQYAWEVTNESTSTIIEIPSDDIKWKLIWKEWRNITAFERATWVALIIDDTPNSVFLSAFDLFRRYIAKKSLEKLIEDWRIQPARIEEIVENTTNEANILLKELWESILDELSIIWVPDDIIPLIGKLRFRTSYWQNILKHSKEVAILATSIAKDLWADVEVAKLWWLLHDIWKSMDQDIEWTHPEIWAKVCKKYWLKDSIIEIIWSHHDEFSTISLETAIVQIADTISSIRPWARREAVEEYLKRVQEMEKISESFSWVNKAYAISAWREIRVFVDSNIISDLEAQDLAREIASNIQEKINYPWEVKINLIREKRVVEYAK